VVCWNTLQNTLYLLVPCSVTFLTFYTSFWHTPKYPFFQKYTTYVSGCVKLVWDTVPFFRSGYQERKKTADIQPNIKCGSEVKILLLKFCDWKIGYPEFGKYLNQTNRRIVYSCSWPAYQVFGNKSPDYASIAKHCNLWRNYGDIQVPLIIVSMMFHGYTLTSYFRIAGLVFWILSTFMLKIRMGLVILQGLEIGTIQTW